MIADRRRNKRTSASSDVAGATYPTCAEAPQIALGVSRAVAAEGSVRRAVRIAQDECAGIAYPSEVRVRVRHGHIDPSLPEAGAMQLSGQVLLDQHAPFTGTHAEQGEGLAFADDLAVRATVDAEGARWSSVEHRASPSLLAPHRMGDGQRRHHPGTAALRTHPRPARRGLRRRPARPPAGYACARRVAVMPVDGEGDAVCQPGFIARRGGRRRTPRHPARAGPGR